jgi:hypothetical protein
MEDHLGIGAGGEAVAAALKVEAQLAEVIDLAVINDPAGLVFV